MSGRPPRRRRALALILVCAAIDVALSAAVVWALRDAPVLPLEIRSDGADETCAWAVVPPPEGELPAETSWVGGGADPVCVLGIAGVTVGPDTLKRDPGYLNSPAALRRWFADRAAIYGALEGGEGTEIEVRIGDDAPVARTVPLSRSLLAHDWAIIFPFPLTALGLLVVGAFVFYRRPDLPSSQALFALCAVVSINCLTMIPVTSSSLAVQPSLARLFYFANMGSLAAAGVSLLMLVSRFPGRQFPASAARAARYALFGVAAVLVGLELSGTAVGLIMGLALFSCVAGLGLIVRATLRARGQVQRLQVRWTLWGLAVPIVTMVALRAPTLLFPDPGDNPLDTLVAISAITIPVGIGIAVLKYRLMNIEVVVRQTIVGAVVVTGFLFLYHLVIAVFAGGLAASPGASVSTFLAVFLTAVIFTFLLQPVQQFLVGLLDRLFFRNRYHYRQLLARVPHSLVETRDPDEAAEIVLGQVCDSMELGRMAIALLPVEGEQRTAWSRGEVAPPPGDEVWAALVAQRTPQLRDEAAEVADPVNRWMGDAGLDLVFPLMVAENVIGVMGCAAPRGRELFTRDDVALLNSVAASLALSLSHSLAFETIQRMNVNLERRVEERTQELEQTRLQLYQWEKMASLGVLAAGVAHELNTPLGVVLSSADQLVGGGSSGQSNPARSRRLAQLCLDGARRAADIVQNLRAFSKPESQDLQLVDVHELIDNTLALLGPRLQSQAIQVVQDRGAILPIEAFPVLLNQTLTNLILNAATAAGDSGEIRITTESREPGKVAVIVEDDGPGVPEDISGRIYEPFFTTRAPGEGSGLGLSLCYTIVEQHGGRIWEEGRPGEGARFVVELPLRPPERLRRLSIAGEQTL